MTTLEAEVGRLVTLAEQADEGYHRNSQVENIQKLLDSDAAHLLAKAELIRAMTDAATLGVPIDLTAIRTDDTPWWRDRAAVWAATTALSALLACIAIVALVVAA